MNHPLLPHQVATRGDRHIAGLLLVRAFGHNPLGIAAITVLFFVGLQHLPHAPRWYALALCAVLAGALLWNLSLYLSPHLDAGNTRMLRTSEGAAVLFLQHHGKISSFAAWPRGHGIGQQLLREVTRSSAEQHTDLRLRCKRPRVAFYCRSGFTVTSNHWWSPTVAMRRPATAALCDKTHR